MPKAPFLISPAYSRAADEDLLARQVDQDDRLAAGAVALRVGLEAGRVDDREVGLEADQVVRRRPDEQVVAEDARPGRLGVGAHASGGSAGRRRRSTSWTKTSRLVHVVDEALRAARRSAPR